MTDPLAKRSLAELDTVLEEIVQRNPAWYKEIQQLVEDINLSIKKMIDIAELIKQSAENLHNENN
jgi:Mg2+ and Co2+ transporter CorA